MLKKQRKELFFEIISIFNSLLSIDRQWFFSSGWFQISNWRNNLSKSYDSSLGKPDSLVRIWGYIRCIPISPFFPEAQKLKSCNICAKVWTPDLYYVNNHFKKKFDFLRGIIPPYPLQTELDHKFLGSYCCMTLALRINNIFQFLGFSNRNTPISSCAIPAWKVGNFYWKDAETMNRLKR